MKIVQVHICIYVWLPVVKYWQTNLLVVSFSEFSLVTAFLVVSVSSFAVELFSLVILRFFWVMCSVSSKSADPPNNFIIGKLFWCLLCCQPSLFFLPILKPSCGSLSCTCFVFLCSIFLCSIVGFTRLNYFVLLSKNSLVVAETTRPFFLTTVFRHYFFDCFIYTWCKLHVCVGQSLFVFDSFPGFPHFHVVCCLHVFRCVVVI